MTPRRAVALRKRIHRARRAHLARIRQLLADREAVSCG